MKNNFEEAHKTLNALKEFLISEHQLSDVRGLIEKAGKAVDLALARDYARKAIQSFFEELDEEERAVVEDLHVRIVVSDEYDVDYGTYLQYTVDVDDGNGNELTESSPSNKLDGEKIYLAIVGQEYARYKRSPDECKIKIPVVMLTNDCQWSWKFYKETQNDV